MLLGFTRFGAREKTIARIMGRQGRIVTDVPIPTLRPRSSTCWLNMRIQPLDTILPMEDGRLVPWIPYPGRDSPIHSVP
jgi:hypothetical protein